MKQYRTPSVTLESLHVEDVIASSGTGTIFDYYEGATRTEALEIDDPAAY